MVKCPGVIGWKANARPPGWKVRENAPLLPGGGGWALLELTDALVRYLSSRAVAKVVETFVSHTNSNFRHMSVLENKRKWIQKSLLEY